MNNGAHKLNQIETYDQLNQRIKRTGYKIHSINYNGYMSSQALQQIQDNAIHARTKLRLDAELAEQNNRLMNLRLSNQNKCLEMEKELKKMQVEFEQKCLDTKSQFTLKMSKSNHSLDLQLKDLEQKKKMEVEQKLQEINETHLDQLADLGVDINKYEIEKTKANKVDKLYQLD